MAAGVVDLVLFILAGVAGAVGAIVSVSALGAAAVELDALASAGDSVALASACAAV